MADKSSMADKAFSSGKVHDTLKNKATPDEVATHMKHEASRARFRIISLVALLIGILILAYYFYHGWWSSNVRQAYVGDKVSITFAACPGVIQEVIYNDPTDKKDSKYIKQMQYASITAALCDLPMPESNLGKFSTWVTNAGSDWRSLGDAFCGSVSAALGDGTRECTATPTATSLCSAIQTRSAVKTTVLQTRPLTFSRTIALAASSA